MANTTVRDGDGGSGCVGPITLRLTVNARPRLNTILMLLGFKPRITVKAV